MSSKAIILGGMLLLLAGCSGFQPVLKREDISQTHTPFTLTVDGIEGYLNHRFYQDVKRHLGVLLPKQNANIAIRITLSQSLHDLSYGRDATALRSQNIIMAAYEISKDGKIIKQDRTTNVASYNLDRNDEFSTLTSRIGSDEQVIKSLAFDVARDIVLNLQHLPVRGIEGAEALQDQKID